MDAKKRILVIGTGGSIAIKSEREATYTKLFSANKLLSFVPSVKRIADIDVSNLLELGSNDMQPKNWIMLAEEIRKQWENYDGFVITHGTDTMHYTSASLSFMIQNPSKPVVITGSRLAIDKPGTDAKRNLINAVKVASSNLNEVVIVFDDKIIRGSRAKKVAGKDMFTSPNFPLLGKVAGRVVLKHEGRTKSKTKFNTKLEEKVFLFKVFPGVDPKLLEYLVGIGYKGIVLEAYGAGDLPMQKNHSFVPVIKYASKHNVPILLSSQVFYGGVYTQYITIYAEGKILVRAGAIPVGDMLPETALVKLMWTLGQTRNPKLVKKLIQAKLSGELSYL